MRYKQTAIGIAWTVLRPFFTMLAFTLVFGKIANLPSEGEIPYPLLVFAATLPWQLFSTAITSTSESLVGNSNLISKVYFPRLLVPASTVGVAIVDFIVSFCVLGVLMAWYNVFPTLQIVTVVPLALLAGILALGPGLILCSLNVTYRDFRYVIPFVTQIGLYISPVGFSSSIVPEKWRLLYECNPMVGVIDGFCWAIHDHSRTCGKPVRSRNRFSS
ncbi:ABC transporter permease [Oleidesulfovibrio sp.]|uniref:ABC transporter permease n=1 Tax=Oleidesulfovibrio sp. TaxID=2909707 RepID=UPI003A896ED4